MMINRSVALVLAIVLVVSFVNGQKLKKCQSCDGVTDLIQVCGNDGSTYASFCALAQQECISNKGIEFACNGECPCDALEVVNFDKKTVRKLQKLRRKYQLHDHEKQVVSKQEFVLDILDDKDIQERGDGMTNLEKKLIKDQVIQLNTEKYYKQGSGNCSTEEMSELPSRLIDWFHVLKTNVREQVMKDEGIEQEPVLKELKFLDSKLKSMYSALACTAQDDDDMEKQVCLTPVQWMFKQLDTNQDASLSATELYEIEQINSEHCIKPFLNDCDTNNDGKVVMKEFCKCLCLTPPCTRVMQGIPTVLLRGEPKPMPGVFTPKCDEDGFFMPTQCNEKLSECWCVDRNGQELEGTRKKRTVYCDINTRKI